MTPTLLDPKNDFVFKRLFTAAPALLADLINAVRASEPPITVVAILNPRLDPAELTGKYIVLDLLARDAAGQLYNVEMQVRSQPDWQARSVYYLAKTLADQLQNGAAYHTLQPVIGIHLLDFDLFPDTDQAAWQFELRDRVQPTVRLGPELQLHIIELAKADRKHRLGGDLAAWITYFKHGQEDTVMTQIAYPPVQQALQLLQTLSADDETRRLAFVRERALRDEISALRGARNEGRQEGRQEGQTAVLERLLAKRFGPLTDDTRQRLAGATPEQLETWAERLLDAPTLSAVFEPH